MYAVLFLIQGLANSTLSGRTQRVSIYQTPMSNGTIPAAPARERCSRHRNPRAVKMAPWDAGFAGAAPLYPVWSHTALVR